MQARGGVQGWSRDPLEERLNMSRHARTVVPNTTATQAGQPRHRAAGQSKAPIRSVRRRIVSRVGPSYLGGCLICKRQAGTVNPVGLGNVHSYHQSYRASLCQVPSPQYPLCVHCLHRHCAIS